MGNLSPTLEDLPGNQIYIIVAPAYRIKKFYDGQPDIFLLLLLVHLFIVFAPLSLPHHTHLCNKSSRRVLRDLVKFMLLK